MFKFVCVLQRQNVGYATQIEKTLNIDDEKWKNITTFQQECHIWPTDCCKRAVRVSYDDVLNAIYQKWV